MVWKDMETFVVLFILIIAGIFIFVIYGIGKGIFNTIAENRYNDSQPVLTKDVKVTGKRIEVSGGSGNNSARTDYYASFEFIENKERIELEVDDEDYGLMAEDDLGKLTFQGRRYHKFQRIL